MRSEEHVIFFDDLSGEIGFIGPVAQALLLGYNLDYGHIASDPIATFDDWGHLTDHVYAIIDMGSCS